MQSDSPNPVPKFVVDAGSDDVMRQFQQLMSQFLQTQALVMTTYLQGSPAAGLPALPAVAAAPRALSPRPASQPHYVAPSVQPVQPVHPAVEAAPAAVANPLPVQQKAAPLPAAAAAPAPALVAAAKTVVTPASSGTSASDLLSQLLDIVSDRTGYPQEMLDPNANIEADLGIDSIKRMEILTAFQQQHVGAQRGAFQGAMEKLTAIKTLRETATVLAELLAGQAEAAVA
jgi:acyl carrier protein